MLKGLFIPVIHLLGRRIERQRFTDPPIYIGGCGRSGTTLLLSILSSHPEIFACPRELNLFEGAWESAEKLVLPKWYRLYRTFIKEKIKKTARRYCEKSPSNIHFVPLIERIHDGNFKMIQIIRDGRDVILSKHPREPEKYWVAPDRWIHDVKAGLPFLEHPNVLTIRYEDLVQTFERTIGKVCNFLDIPITEEILNWHEFATVINNRALFSPIEQLKSTSVGKWKNTENADFVREFTSRKETMELLKKYNYVT